MIVMGAGIIAIGIVADDTFFLTVGLSTIVADGVWRLWLGIPEP
jgi:hypothetical protein